MVAQVLEDSPYPYLLCGDLNDVPNSYTIFYGRGNLQDAFLEKGFAMVAERFRYAADRLYFADRNFDILQFNRVENYSDHYPISGGCAVEVRGVN